MAAILFSASAAVVNSQDNSPEKHGEISGTLKYADGRLAPNMQLFVLENNTSFRFRSQTGDHGQFLLTNLTMGEYVIYPYGDYEEYPPRGNTFLSKDPDRVVLTKDRPIVVKNLTLPEKAGVIDGTTISPLRSPFGNVRVVLCHTDEVSRSAEIVSDERGHFRYVVPSGEKLSVYTQSGDNPASQVANLVLSPGEKKQISFTTADTRKAPSHIEGEVCKPFRS